jgi:hypothetical protein
LNCNSFSPVGVVGAYLTSTIKGSGLFVSKYWSVMGYSSPPAEFLVHSVENDEEKKKNLVAALSCTEEEAVRIQNQLLPSLEIPNDAKHL